MSFHLENCSVNFQSQEVVKLTLIKRSNFVVVRTNIALRCRTRPCRVLTCVIVPPPHHPPTPQIHPTNPPAVRTDEDLGPAGWLVEHLNWRQADTDVAAHPSTRDLVVRSQQQNGGYKFQGGFGSRQVSPNVQVVLLPWVGDVYPRQE